MHVLWLSAKALSQTLRKACVTIHISPIANYRFEPIPQQAQPDESPKSKIDFGYHSTQQTNTTEKVKDYVYDGGDIDSSERWFDYRDPFLEPEDFNRSLFKEQLESANEAHALYSMHGRGGSTYHATAHHSFLNMTVPEALIYDDLLRNKRKSSPLRGVLKISKKPLWPNPLTLTLQLILNGSVLTEWELRYAFQDLRIHIYQENKEVGTVQYRIRGQKMEEVEGFLYGKPFVLDPVWNATRKGDLETEHLTVNGKRHTLIYKGSDAYSVIESQHKYTEKTDRIEETQKFILTRRSISVNTYTGRMDLIYIRGIFLPVGGQWVFKVEGASRGEAPSRTRA